MIRGAIPPLLTATLRQHLRSLLSWAISLSVFGVVMLALYPSVKGNQDFATLLNSYPEALRKLFALSDYTTPTGYLRAEVFSFLAPLLLSLFAVFVGADLIAGEEARGTLDSFVTCPLSRQRLYAQQLTALLLMVFAVACTLGLVLGLGGHFMGLTVPMLHLLAAVVAMALLAALIGTFSLSIGAATGRRGMALTMSAVLLIGSYLLSQLATLVPWLEHLRPLSPWWHSLGVDPLAAGFLPWHLLTLGVALGLTALAGAHRFNRRDLGV